MKTKSCLIVLFWLYFMPNFGQSPPTVDDNWILNSNQSDEFNSTTFNHSLWNRSYCHGGCFSGCNMHPNHVTLDGSNVVLTLDYLDDPWNNWPNEDLTVLWSAGISSDNFDYSYGYLEMRAILPGYYDNGEATGEGLWPAFWTYYTEFDNDCWNVLDEIDILEPSGSQYADARTNVFGWHDELDDCTREKSGEFIHSNLPVLFEDYHTFAIEWLPERIIYYFDGEPVYSSFDDESVPNNPQRVRMEFQLGGGGTWPDPNAPYPLEYTIDYFRYYQLDMSNCNNSVTIRNNTELNNFTYGVRRNIAVGTSSSSISLNSGDNITLRASGEISINGEFTVPLGAELSLIPTPCH